MFFLNQEEEVVFTLEQAIELALQHHKGQRDRAGQPYILHLLRVMLQLNTPEGRIAGVLHDIIEDTSLTQQDLLNLGCPSNIVEAIVCVSKLPSEETDYDAFIRRIDQGPVLARQVKLADLRDNADLSRIPHPTTTDRQRVLKYHRAMGYLEESLSRVIEHD